MSKTEKIDEALKKEELMLKSVAYFQENISAWIQNRMEVDKQILTFSSLAIGLLATFHDDIQIIWELSRCSGIIALILWFITIASFGFTSYMTVKIFRENSDYIMASEIDSNEKEIKKLENSLDKKGRISTCTFTTGIIMTVFFVIFIIVI